MEVYWKKKQKKTLSEKDIKDITKKDLNIHIPNLQSTEDSGKFIYLEIGANLSYIIITAPPQVALMRIWRLDLDFEIEIR